MITMTYSYWVKTVNAAGCDDCEQVRVSVDFETDDADHANELAMRFWDDQNMQPANYIADTLVIS